MVKIKITFHGAARVVTGSCYLLEYGQTRFLVDCGMFQGTKKLKERNYGSFPFNPGSIDFVLLTHAHIDHSGLLPKLYKAGFSGPTYATSGTVELCKVMLPDSGHIQEMEIERKNRKNQRSGLPLITPIYTAADGEECTNNFVKVDYDQYFEPGPGIRVKMRDAGHILGSAILEISFPDEKTERKMVFTGDLGRSDHPIINDPTLVDEADYLIIESTYGNRFHEQVDDDEVLLADAINDTFRRGGNVIIPAFAVDRTQDLLFTLNNLMENKKINPEFVYVDSPLAIAATEIFSNHPQYFDSETTKFISGYGRCPFLLKNLSYTKTSEESMALNQIKKGAIIISASGMADAGRIKHHLKHNLWRSESTVIFAGYQAEGTLGRRLLDGEKKVRIHGEEIMVNAQILMLEGYSAHADQQELLNWLNGFKKIPPKIFITHGEESASLTFAQLVMERFSTETLVPSMGDSYDLARNRFTVFGEPLEIMRNDAVFELFNQINLNLSYLVKERSFDKLEQVRDFLLKIKE